MTRTELKTPTIQTHLNTYISIIYNRQKCFQANFHNVFSIQSNRSVIIPERGFGDREREKKKKNLTGPRRYKIERKKLLAVGLTCTAFALTYSRL